MQDPQAQLCTAVRAVVEPHNLDPLLDSLLNSHSDFLNPGRSEGDEIVLRAEVLRIAEVFYAMRLND